MSICNDIPVGSVRVCAKLAVGMSGKTVKPGSSKQKLKLKWPRFEKVHIAVKSQAFISQWMVVIS